MYVITTKFVGPTDHRGARITAVGPKVNGDATYTRATVPFLHEEGGGAEQYQRAARAVVDKLRAAGWRVKLGDGGALPDESGYVFLLQSDAY